ncbi:hypothetical protein ACWD4L_31875 [Streptomyces sp. NPDC002596]
MGSLRADTFVQAAVTDGLMAEHLADDVAAVTDSWVRNLDPAQLLAGRRPADGVVTDALTDAVPRALLHRAAGRDRSATLTARIIVQAMIPAAVRVTRGQVRPFGGRTFDDIGHMTVAAPTSSPAPGASTPGPAGRQPRPGRPATGVPRTRRQP